MPDDTRTTKRAPTKVRRLAAALAVLAAAGSAVGLLGAPPAGAREYPASHAHIGNSSHGFATFETSGDRLSLCDLRSDGYGIGVQWWLYAKGSWIRQSNHYNSWGIDTCRSFDESSLPEGASIQYRACLYDHASPGGAKPVQIGGSCGPKVKANTAA